MKSYLRIEVGFWELVNDLSNLKLEQWCTLWHFIFKVLKSLIIN